MECANCVINLESFWKRLILDIFYSTWHNMWASGNKTVTEMHGMYKELLWPHFSLFRDTDQGQRCKSFKILLEADLVVNRATDAGGEIYSEVQNYEPEGVCGGHTGDVFKEMGTGFGP